MNVTWHKVWRDLATNKARTLLTVLSTAVGVLAIGLVLGLSGLMRARLTEAHRASTPAHVTLHGGPFERADVDAVLRESGVADAEGSVETPFRWRLEDEVEWRNGNLVARAGYERQRMNRMDLLDGRWPAERELVVELQSARYAGISPGATILVDWGGRARRLPVAGVARAPTVLGPQMMGVTTFFATPETVAGLLGQGEHFSQIDVRLESFSPGEANEAARRLERRLERLGRPVDGYRIADPGVHWMQETVDTVFLILGVLGALSLGLSAFLIVNTMNAIVAQQVWQIGVMKAVGATVGRVMRVYLAAALVYGGLALFVAVPLGAVGAHLMAGWMLEIFNVSGGTFRVVPAAVAAHAAVGLAMPVLASLVPVIGGARVSIRRAISNYGIVSNRGAGSSYGWLDRFLGQVRRLPRPLMLSLRNTFRRRARVALTLITLVLGGVMFIVVMSVDASFNHSVDMLMQRLGYDVMVQLDRHHRSAWLAGVTRSVSGVTAVEVWDYRGATLSLASGEERGVQLWGMPSGFQMFSPDVVGGRGLLPGDGHALLLDDTVAAEEGIRVGDRVELTIGGRESAWTVVGLVLSISTLTDDCYAPFDTVTREVGAVHRGNQVFVRAARHDEESHRALTRALRRAYAARHVGINVMQSVSENREQNRNTFRAVTYLLLTMAVLAAVVGSIGLMGTMSINVVERGREIGVMRAIGASSVAISGIFVGEGLFLGLLSWLIAVPLSLPGARAFSNLVGHALLNRPLHFSYSLGAVQLWLAIVAVLSTVASLWPALRATKVSVREALAYE